MQARARCIATRNAIISERRRTQVLKSDMRKVLALLQAYQAAAILPRPPELITGELDHE